jgi:hypothetical protein
MKPKNMWNRAHGQPDSSSPDSRHRLESIFNAVWGELRQYPDRESVKKQVAERVALYSNSGLQDDQRIKLAVLNSFGRAG